MEVITTAVRWYFRYRLSAGGRARPARRAPPRRLRPHGAGLGAHVRPAAGGRRAAARPTGRHDVVRGRDLRAGGGRWAYLYRAVDEYGQVVDVLLREHRDLASARAFFDQAIARRGVRPEGGDHGQTRRLPAGGAPAHLARAAHPHRACTAPAARPPRPIERSHVPVKDRLRPMRGLQSIATGQRLLEGIELAHAIRRGHVPGEHGVRAARDGARPHTNGPAQAADTFIRLASSLACAA